MKDEPEKEKPRSDQSPPDVRRDEGGDGQASKPRSDGAKGHGDEGTEGLEIGG